MLQHFGRDLPQLLSGDNLAFLGRAAFMTVALTSIGCGTGFVIGFAIALLRNARGAWLLPLKIVAVLYVEMFRRVPFLVTLFVVLFTAQAIAPHVPLFAVAVVSICTLSSAYLAEIIRAGFESVPPAQTEAAAAMNFGYARTMSLVVVPQSWRVILPPALAYAVMFVKDTALVSQAGVFELMFAGKALSNRGFDPVVVFSVVLALYVAIAFPLARFGAWLESRMSRRLTPTALPLDLPAADGAGGLQTIGRASP